MSRSEKVVVRRSPWRALVVALAGVPLVLLVLDYVWGIGGFFDAIIDWSYGSKDPEAWEPRDDILAALLGVIGAGMILFGLKELIAPRRVFRADTSGVQVPLSGPLGRRSDIGWTQIEDVSSDGKSLLLHLTNAGGIPSDPWGATWDGERTLRIPTGWWERKPEWVIDQVAQKGLPDEVRRRQAERQLEESRAHAAAMEVISGAAVVRDPTVDESTYGDETPTGEVDPEDAGTMAEDDIEQDPTTDQSEPATESSEQGLAAEPEETDPWSDEESTSDPAQPEPTTEDEEPST